ncbi:MAG: response regulator transcription factor [Flavobacterium sp.]|nr:response regulator transcription factor [Candidatus Neoflavobacterium equi]
MNILLIEDDVRLNHNLQRLLEEASHQVTAVFDGKSGCALALNMPFDLVITDVMLPKMDGKEMCLQIKKHKPNLPVLMLTALGSTDNKIDGFHAGADDYLVKPFEIREFIARVHVLLKRYHLNTPPTPQLFTYANLSMNTATKQVWRSQTEITLTPKEFNLLRYFMEHPERVLDRTEIATKVWDTHIDTGTNFIDVYINYLRNKIDKDYEPKLIHTKTGMGFILKH